MAEELHSFLSPAASPRWVVCPGSALLESLAPDLGDDKARREGTACHWVMEERFTDNAPVPEGMTAPNGVMVTGAMVEAVDALQEDIESRLGPNWRSMIIVERRVQIPRVHERCWGTPDVRAWAQIGSRRKLFVWDLKFGFSRVEAFEAWQLIAYASGCLSEAADSARAFNQPVWSEEAVDCELIIVQPRAYHPQGIVRTWAVLATGLRDYVHRLSMAADEATEATPVCKPQPEACENCNARATCETLQKAAYRCMDIAEQATQRDLSDEALGLELALLTDAGALIEARKSGLEELVKHRLKGASRITHWYYAPGQAAVKWAKPVPEVITLGRMLGINLQQPPEAVTPKQAVKAGLPQSLADQYSQTIPGATKLTRSDGSEIRKIFSNAK